MNRNPLMDTLIGHLALLEQRHPKKAASPVARKLKQHLSRPLQQAASPR